MSLSLWRTALSVALIGFIGMSACTAIYRSHGYVPNETDVAEIEVGVTERSDVVRALGQPAVRNSQYGESWFYIRTDFRHFNYEQTKIVDREIVVVSFDDSGPVSNVERYGLEDGRVVAMSRRVTETNLGRLSVIEQLLRSLGRIDPAELIDRN